MYLQDWLVCIKKNKCIWSHTESTNQISHGFTTVTKIHPFMFFWISYKVDKGDESNLPQHVPGTQHYWVHLLSSLWWSKVKRTYLLQSKDRYLYSTRTWTTYFRIQKEVFEKGSLRYMKYIQTVKIFFQNYNRKSCRMASFRELFFTVLGLSGFIEMMFPKFLNIDKDQKFSL